MNFENTHHLSTIKTPVKRNTAFFQPQLTINQPNDAYEQKADKIADKVMRMSINDQPFFKPSPLSISRLQRKCQKCEEEEKMQRKETNSEVTVEDTSTENYISSLSGKGSSLTHEEKSFFEPRFGYDFSDVRLHTNTEANESSKNVNALAYTHGNNIVFGLNQYQPGTNKGKELLSHELTHVIQQKVKASAKPNLQRQNSFTIGKGKKARTFQIGEIHFEGDATRKEMLKAGSLLPSQDEAHIAFSGDLLGYEISYTSPVDPFRWNKLKEIIDSNTKVIVKKVALTDNFDMAQIDPSFKGGRQTIPISLVSIGAAGYTLVDESLQKSIYPSDTKYNVSPISGTTIVYYSTTFGNPSDSSLAHELFGHFWLALKGVPFVHPSTKTPAGKALVTTHGTLTKTHKILDPFGNIYTGTVGDFINTYIGSQSGIINSPTQNVGTVELSSALTTFKVVFIRDTKGSLNGHWEYKPTSDSKLLDIDSNYRLAPASAAGSGISQKSIIADLTLWYSSIGTDKQYILWQFFSDSGTIIQLKSSLAGDLISAIKPPHGMKTP